MIGSEPDMRKQVHMIGKVRPGDAAFILARKENMEEHDKKKE